MRWIEPDSSFSDSSAAEARTNKKIKTENYWSSLKTSSSELLSLEPRDLELFKNVYNMSLEDLLARKGEPKNGGTVQSDKKLARLIKMQSLKTAIDERSFSHFMCELYPASTLTMNEIRKLSKKNEEKKTVNEFEKNSIVLLKEKSIKNSWIYFKELCDLLLYSAIEEELIKAVRSGFGKKLTVTEYQHIKILVADALSKKHDNVLEKIKGWHLPNELKQIVELRLKKRTKQLKKSWMVNGIYLADELSRIYSERKEYEAWLAQCEKKQKIYNQAYNSISLNDLREQFERKLRISRHPVNYREQEKTGTVSLGDMMLTHTKTVLEYIFEAYRTAPKSAKKILYTMAEEALIHGAKYKINPSHSEKLPWETTIDLLSECKQLPWELIRLLLWYAGPTDQANQDIRDSCYLYSGDGVFRENVLQKPILKSKSTFGRIVTGSLKFCIKPFFSVDIFETRGVPGTILACLLSAGENSQVILAVGICLNYLAERGSTGSSSLFNAIGKATYSVETGNSMIAVEPKPYQVVLFQAMPHLDEYKNHQNKKITNTEEVPLMDFNCSSDYSSTLSL